MEKEFVPYEQALRLKVLGFEEPCFGYYSKGVLSIEIIKNGKFFTDEDSIYFEIDNSCLAPTFSQTFRWFREKYGLSGWVNEAFRGDSRQGIVSIKSEIGLEYRVGLTKIFETYEEAELACLNELIEIVELK